MSLFAQPHVTAGPGAVLVVKAFLREGAKGRVHLERLPGYAADLNPDENVGQHLKSLVQHDVSRGLAV